MVELYTRVMQSVLVLGRQPELGLAELESLYGSERVTALGEHAALVDVDPCLLAFSRLGGSTKFCKLLTILDTINWKQIESFLRTAAPQHATTMPEGKMTLGLSAIGLNVTTRQLEATGLTLKKAIRASGRPVRLVPNKELVISTPQVIYNKLTSPNGWELVFIAHEGKTYVVQTVKVQDINDYTVRDRERPKRDAKVGMLPPKLAQIIINLASGPLPDETLQNICDIPAGEPIPRTLLGKTLLDPFCGTGVVLQEAALMGYDVYGTDLEPRMISYTKQNLEWLESTYGLRPTVVGLETADATAHTWSPTPDIVACETYLGRPFTDRPTQEILAQTMADCNLIIKKFLKNIHAQLQPGTRLCLAIPAWQIRPNEFKHLSLVDQIEEMGYNRVSFEHAGNDNRLLYYRADQIVGRELITLIRSKN